MEKSLAQKFKEVRASQEQLYTEFREEFGKFRVGPSANGGMYINMLNQPKDRNVSNINQDEAVFLIRKLKEFFGLD